MDCQLQERGVKKRLVLDRAIGACSEPEGGEQCKEAMNQKEERLSADPARQGPKWLMTARWAQSSGCLQTWEYSSLPSPALPPQLAHGWQLAPPRCSSFKESALSRHQPLFIWRPMAGAPPLTPARRCQPWSS